jgi:hypothetical protein
MVILITLAYHYYQTIIIIHGLIMADFKCNQSTLMVLIFINTDIGRKSLIV